MRVVVAPDSFGGSLTAAEAASAIADGWRRARPDDDIVTIPMSDGGEGLVDVLAAAVGGDQDVLEVAGPLGQPVEARWVRVGATAYVESAQAAGLALVAADQRSPLRSTTYGVGQLLEAVRAAGVEHVVVGLGGSATVDGGAGALTALGLRLMRADGNGLKVGGGELHHVRSAAHGWLDEGWAGVTVACWADVRTALLDAPARFGPQKGAGPEDVELLRGGLEQLSEVLQRDLGVSRGLRDAPGTGAAGGLGYGLAAVLGADIVDGAPAVADVVGLDRRLADADLVVTGEGAVDRSSLDGKVVGHVVERASAAGAEVTVVAGRLTEPVSLEVVEASPGGPGDDPAATVTAAVERLAVGFS